MNTLEVLEAGRKLIAKNWAHGEWGGNSGKEDQTQCSAGAINRVVFGQVHMPNGATRAKYPEWANSLLYLSNAIKIETGRKPTSIANHVQENVGTVIGFNDADEQTQEGVLKVFDRAIRNAKRRHPKG